MKNGLHNSQMEEHRIVGDIIEDVKICMLTTTAVGLEGELESRPMQAQEIDAQGNLWFFTSTQSKLIDQVRAHLQVHVTFASPAKNEYISASASAVEVKDRAKMEELWSPALKAWFKDGLETPDLVLMKVELEELQYWSSPSSPVVKIAGFVKALVSDEPFRPGKQGKVDLRH